VTIRLLVIRDDPRARALLAAVGRGLGVGALAPDASGDVFVAFDASADGDPWERLRAALDDAGDDWWEYLHLPSRAVTARMSAERR
jgi:hypothetical protein